MPEPPAAAQNKTPVISLPKDKPSVESLAQVVRLTKHSKGVQVYPGRPERTLFDQAGLKPGDVVTHINGNDLQNPAAALSLYQQVQDMRSASFQVLRNGETITLGVDIDNQ